MVADTRTIVREVRIAALPHEVFPYFTEAQRLVRWQGVEAELDPRPGGLFRVRFGSGQTASGRYLEVDCPRRLVYTWGWETEGTFLPSGASTVEVDFVSDDDGTIVRVTHSGLPPQLFDIHVFGWDDTLPGLANVVEASR